MGTRQSITPREDAMKNTVSFWAVNLDINRVTVILDLDETDNAAALVLLAATENEPRAEVAVNDADLAYLRKSLQLRYANR